MHVHKVLICKPGTRYHERVRREKRVLSQVVRECLWKFPKPDLKDYGRPSLSSSVRSRAEVLFGKEDWKNTSASTYTAGVWRLQGVLGNWKHPCVGGRVSWKGSSGEGPGKLSAGEAERWRPEAFGTVQDRCKRASGYQGMTEQQLIRAILTAFHGKNAENEEGNIEISQYVYGSILLMKIITKISQDFMTKNPFL